jgi:pimeloyl-ACP methyl ester carboxylesterase
MPHLRVVFLGGNGHCEARVTAARKALAGEAVELADVRYPGFEGRPRAQDLDAFLTAVSRDVNARAQGTAHVYATGIGGLVALGLRARGEWLDVPLLLQAPVLWGLERRWMPRLMRLRVARAAAGRLFASRPFQRAFVRRYFMKPPSLEMRTAFFDGYASCTAFEDLFAWFTPRWLRQLGEQLAGRPAAVENVRVWWGGRDRVVTPRELTWTEESLGTRWPLSVFAGWGHYPMIDEPEAWARALAMLASGRA